MRMHWLLVSFVAAEEALHLLQTRMQTELSGVGAARQSPEEFPLPPGTTEWSMKPKPKFGPDGTWATPYCEDINGCDPYCPPGCDGTAYWERPYDKADRRPHYLGCDPGPEKYRRPKKLIGSASLNKDGGFILCQNSENASKPKFWKETWTTAEKNAKGIFTAHTQNGEGDGWGNEFCPDNCVNDCATYKMGEFLSCGYDGALGGFLGYDRKTREDGPNRFCPVGKFRTWAGGRGMSYSLMGATWCMGTTTTTTTDSGHVCKHYESEDSCPSQRCSWDGDACADPPCSSHASEDDCCGDCEWEAGQCQPAIFKACPDEGKAGTNVCPEGCTFVDNCEQCEFAAGVWKKDYSKEPWPQRSGSRPQGCFRNRKFNIKCNKFEPGSKYPSGVDKVGTKKGKWPICKIIEPPKKCR